MTPNSELRFVSRADVYKKGVLAGSLVREGGTVTFRYLPAYVEAGLPAIATTLPHDASGLQVVGGALPPYFANLLPEGIRLLGLKERTKTSLDDHLTLLLAVGRDCVGDISVVPEGENLEAPLSQAVSYEIDDLFVRAQAAEDPVALSGVQEKVSSSMLTLPALGPQGPAIVKFAPPNLPRLVENERFFMEMARGCGLSAAKVQILPDEKGRLGLWIERFDRIRSGQEWRRLAQEDGCQILDAYPSQKYSVSVQALASAFSREAAAPLVALRSLLAQLAFSYLIGNGDQHAKNLSLGETNQGWMPTPAYDLLSTLFYPGLDQKMALKMDGKDERWKRKSFVAFFGRYGVPERAVNRVLNQLCDASLPWIDRLEEIGFDEKATQGVRNQILARRDNLGR